MAVPKRKMSRARRGNRRAHDQVGKPNIRPCPNCGSYGLPHRVCADCGHYKGKQVFIPKSQTSAESS